MKQLNNRNTHLVSARIVPNEVGGSVCTCPEFCVNGVLESVESDDAYKEKWGSGLELGVKPLVPPAIRAPSGNSPHVLYEESWVRRDAATWNG